MYFFDQHTTKNARIHTGHSVLCILASNWHYLFVFRITHSGEMLEQKGPGMWHNF